MDSGVSDLERILAFKEPTPGGIQPMLVKSLCCLLRLLVRLLADLVILFHHRLGLLLGHRALVDELLAIKLQDVLVLLDDRVHDWLGEHWLVNFIVAKLPVPNQINDNIPGKEKAHISRWGKTREEEPLPGGAPLGGEVGDHDARLGVVRVHVEDRRVHNAADVSAVRRGAGVPL